MWSGSVFSVPPPRPPALYSESRSGSEGFDFNLSIALRETRSVGQGKLLRAVQLVFSQDLMLRPVEQNSPRVTFSGVPSKHDLAFFALELRINDIIWP